MSIIAARRTGPSDAQATVAFATILAAIVVGMLSLFASPASATPLLHAENGVGVIAHGACQRVGAHEQKLAGESRQRAPNYDRSVVGSGVGAETAGAGASTDLAELEAGGGRGASFITNSNGETVPIPEGATGPTPVRSGNGFQFTGGSGGNGLSSRVAGVRIMDPVTTGKYPYPNGYVSYFNEAGQTVNPYTGQTISPSDPFWHWAWSP